LLGVFDPEKLNTQSIFKITPRGELRLPPGCRRAHLVRAREHPISTTTDLLANSLAFDRQDITSVSTGGGIGPYLSVRLVAECGTDLSRWPSAKHFTSWLTLSPGRKVSGGKVLSSHTRKTTNRVASLLRLAAVTVGKTNTALGAFYRRLAARIGKAKAVTATARKIAVLFYSAMRFGMKYVDPGADHYERRYKERVIKQLHRRAAELGFSLQPAEGVS